MFTNHLNHHYLIIKTKLNNKEVRWIEELIVFDFTIIYCKMVKNLADSLSRRFNFKDNSKLSIMKCQPLLNFLSKFQKHLKNAKNDPIEEQNIDFNETSLLRSVLNLIGVLQDINFTRVLPIRNKSRDEYLNFVSNSIDYIQVRILYFKLVFITKRNND